MAEDKKNKKNKVAEDQKIEIPNDLMIEIALRLPANSIGRFKCVSKEWKLLLSTHEFVKSYHNRRKSNHDKIILVQDVSFPAASQTIHVITPATDSRLKAVRVPRSRLFRGSRKMEVLGSGNGLVLLHVLKNNGKSNFVVINPVTSKATIVPKLLALENVCNLGMGYSSVDDDYKIVVLKRTRRNWTTTVNIYSVKTRTRCKKSTKILFKPSSNHRAVCADGRLHWLAYKYNDENVMRKKYAIIAFDFSTEKFEEVPFPTGFDPIKLMYCNLAVMGGCLALIEGRCSYFDVWITEKLGYWRKFTIPNQNQNGNIICKLGEFEFMLVKDYKNEFVAYNYETGVWRNLNIKGRLPRAFNPAAIGTRMMAFRENLLCPSKKFKGFI